VELDTVILNDYVLSLKRVHGGLTVENDISRVPVNHKGSSTHRLGGYENIRIVVGIPVPLD
jgi:hypothetical protein